MTKGFIMVTLLVLFFPDNKMKNNWDNVKLTNSIEDYQNYLINNPETPHIKEITDSLRIFWERINIRRPHNNSLGLNNFRLLINYEGRLLFEHSPIEKGYLKVKIINSIINTPYVETRIIELDTLGTFEVSKGTVDIATDIELSPDIYSSIIQLVKDSFIELRNYYSNKIWEKNLDELNPIQLEIIEREVPINIRFETYNTQLKPGPPLLKFWPDSLIIKEFECQ